MPRPGRAKACRPETKIPGENRAAPGIGTGSRRANSTFHAKLALPQRKLPQPCAIPAAKLLDPRRNGAAPALHQGPVAMAGPARTTEEHDVGNIRRDPGRAAQEDR